MSANSSIFGTLTWTNPITLKLYKNKEDIILIENHEKKLPLILAIWPKWPFEISKISKFTKLSKVSQRREIFFPRVIFIVKTEYEIDFHVH